MKFTVWKVEKSVSLRERQKIPSREKLKRIKFIDRRMKLNFQESKKKM